MSPSVTHPEGSGLRQPATIAEWRAAKKSAFDYTLERFADLVALAERGLVLAGRLPPATLSPKADVDGHRVVLSLILTRCHGQLWNALDLLLERQAGEALALLRPAVELAADAAKISRKGDLWKVWLNRERDEGAFNKAFKPQFPRGDRLTGPLYNVYQICCGYGSHSAPALSAFRVSADEKGATFHYFVQDDGQIELQIRHFIVTLSRIVDVFEEGLAPLDAALPQALEDWRREVPALQQGQKQ